MVQYKRYICNFCGAVFCNPDVDDYVEDLNGEGALYVWHIELCPECRSEDIEEYTEDEDDA